MPETVSAEPSEDGIRERIEQLSEEQVGALWNVRTAAESGGERGIRTREGDSVDQQLIERFGTRVPCDPLKSPYLPLDLPPRISLRPAPRANLRSIGHVIVAPVRNGMQHGVSTDFACATGGPVGRVAFASGCARDLRCGGTNALAAGAAELNARLVVAPRRAEAADEPAIARAAPTASSSSAA